jgi:hypothetical protein
MSDHKLDDWMEERSVDPDIAEWYSEQRWEQMTAAVVLFFAVLAILVLGIWALISAPKLEQPNRPPEAPVTAPTTVIIIDKGGK